MKKRELLLVGAVLVLLAGAVAAWMYEKPANQEAVEQAAQNEQAENPDASSQSATGTAACSSEQMQCADGTVVFRTPPDCRFVCPDVSTKPIIAISGALDLKIGETGKLSEDSDVEITPMGILEDSRCPVDVQCIQAGTVRLRANVLTKTGPSTADFKLGAATTVGGQTITLVSVLPEKNSAKTITYADYTFTFKIGK